jgi:S-phase kinase-associated protein 1
MEQSEIITNSENQPNIEQVPTIELVTKNGEVLKVSQQVAKMSVLIKNMIEEAQKDEQIPIPEVEINVMKKIVDFCTEYLKNPYPEIEKPIQDSDMNKLFPEFYAKYCDVDKQLLFALALASNYLDIGPLLDLVFAKLATMIKGKSTEEIRTIFEIENDFTPEEEAALKEEYKWIEEL